MAKQTVQIVPELRHKMRKVFKTDAEYQAFCERWREQITPALERNKEARRKSMEAAMSHFVD